MVDVNLRVLYKPEPNRLPWILKRLGQDYDDRVLPSIVNETLKAVMVSLSIFTLEITGFNEFTQCSLWDTWHVAYVGYVVGMLGYRVSQAQFNASQLITQRELVSKQIRSLLQERALEFGIAVDDVSIVSTAKHYHMHWLRACCFSDTVLSLISFHVLFMIRHI